MFDDLLTFTVRKSNSLVLARTRLSLFDMRLINFVVAHNKPTDEEFKIVEVPVMTFHKLYRSNSKDYCRFKDIAEKMLEITVTISEEQDLKWFEYSEYLSGLGILRLRLNSALKPYLLNLQKDFVEYDLNSIKNLKHSWSIRLFELLKTDESHRYSLEDLRNVLGLYQHEYPQYANLKKRILLCAQKEISDICDISFSFREIKRSRRVVGIIFQVFIKP